MNEFNHKLNKMRMRSTTRFDAKVEKVDPVREPLKFVTGENFQTEPPVPSMPENLALIRPLAVASRKNAVSTATVHSDRSDIRIDAPDISAELNQIVTDRFSTKSRVMSVDPLETQLNNLSIQSPANLSREVSENEVHDQLKNDPYRTRFRRSEHDHKLGGDDFFSLKRNPELNDYLSLPDIKNTEMLEQYGHLEVESNVEEILARWKPGQPFPSDEEIRQWSKEKNEKAKKALENAED